MKILIEESVLRQALEALDVSYSLQESSHSIHKGKTLLAFKVLCTALDAAKVGAVIDVDIPTIAAFADELRRVKPENEELRAACVRFAAVKDDYEGPLPRPACDCEGWGCWGCCDTEDQISLRQGTFR